MKAWLHKGEVGAGPVLNVRRCALRSNMARNTSFSQGNVRTYNWMIFEVVSKELVIFEPYLRE